MPTPHDIAVFKKELRDLLVSKSIGEVLLEMKLSLPAHSSKHNQLLELQARLNRVNRNENAGTLSFDERNREYAKITQALIELIDTIELSDFEVQGNAQSDRKRKRGSILYRIPNLMQLNQETKCLVRLAFLEEIVKENLELTEDTHIQSIRISEVMSVELLDRSQQGAFSITTHNQAEQFLDEDYYSEWIFYVKPLLEGFFPLVLKVSVIEEVRGKERVREIVLEESIQIVTGARAQDAAFQAADYEISRAGNVRGIEPMKETEPTLTKPKKENYQKDLSQKDYQEEIEDSIKTNMEHLLDKWKLKRQIIRRENQESVEQKMEVIQLTKLVSVSELAFLLDVTITDVMMSCINMGISPSINQQLNAESIKLIAEEYGLKIEFAREEN